MAEQKKRELRVVMFPWLAYGHMKPFLELAKSLATHGLKVFFVSTPLNIQRIEPQMYDAPGIDLVQLAMPSVEGLPAGVESTADIGKEGGGLIPLLIQAMDLLEKPFEALLRQLSPDFVVHDFVHHWVPRVAIPIPTILFLVLGAASISFAEGQLATGMENPTADDLTVPPPGFPSSIVRRRLFEARKVVALYRKQKQAESVSLIDRGSMCARESWAVVFNTCVEVEGVYVEYLQALWRRPVVPAGFLMPKLPPPPDGDDDICLQWLDRQPAASVVLVSFGTECALTVDEIAAMAMGLQQSGASFLWILPAGNTLPQGFQDQIREKGLVVTKWAPQLYILNHSSTGAFLTHCGWNSITEGLRFGVPLIALPMQFEQGLNARLVQELNVGVEVKRNEENGSFTKEDISKAIRGIMAEGEGVKIKYNVKKISNMLTRDNFQVYERNITNFVSMLKKYNK